jgi:hypothetical protein
MAGGLPIPISEIKAYAEYNDINGYQQRQTLLKRIQIMDRVFLDWHNKKEPENNG